MGKSPAKWIKTLLLGKKSSKSNLSKGREKLNSANKGEVLVSSKVTVSDLSVDPPSISAPILVTSARNVMESETDIPTKLPNDGGNIPSVKEDGSDNAISNLGNLEDPERIRLDQAAAKAQAAFRGYLARRAFRTLKGIIRLQALIRGHLVRRQAVATLCCTWGIVKFQALARGQKVRCSDVGVEVQKKHLLLGSKSSDSYRVSTSAQVKNLSNNAFVQKLLASLPAALPLRLQYGPEEPNLSWQWLQRWTRSRFWEAPSQPIKSLASKSKTKGDANGQGKTRRSVRKVSNAKVENGSSRSNLEYEKPKRGLRRVFGNTADSAREHSQNELEKVKRNLRKLSDSAKEVFDKSEVVNEKTKQTLKKTSSSDAPDVSEQESTEKMIDVTATLSEPSNLEADLKLSTLDASPDESNISPAVDLLPAENNGEIENMQVTEELSSKDEQVSDESSKANQRRASFPAKIDNQENGLNSMPKVPSYMAPTESAKARLRGQGSPRFTRDVVEKNGLNRRYSLPSSTTNNLSSLSPRAQRLVQVAGKGAIRNEKSISSSRDANDKVVRAEWKR
ncbi:IQ motif [Theobroma cacao]|nr:IQ motif [Theobroma cacao]